MVVMGGLRALLKRIPGLRAVSMGLRCEGFQERLLK